MSSLFTDTGMGFLAISLYNDSYKPTLTLILNESKMVFIFYLFNLGSANIFLRKVPYKQTNILMYSESNISVIINIADKSFILSLKGTHALPHPTAH